MRRYDFNGSPKAISAGGGVVTFTPSDLDSNRIAAFHLQSVVTAGGAGNGIDAIDRIRVKANGVTRWDLSGAQLAQFWERVSWSNVLYGSASNTITLPFYNLMEPDEDMADQCQFEPGANASVEITYGSGALAGFVFIGWTQTNIPPVYYTKLVGQQMNINDGAVNGRFNIVEGGGIMAWAIPSLGLQRARLVLNGTQWLNMPGVNFKTVAASAGTVPLIAEIQRFSTAQVPSTTIPLHYVTVMTRKPENGIPGVAGSSYIELDTGNHGGTWAGTGNELLLYSAVPISAAG